MTTLENESLKKENRDLKEVLKKLIDATKDKDGKFASWHKELRNSVKEAEARFGTTEVLIPEPLHIPPKDRIRTNNYTSHPPIIDNSADISIQQRDKKIEERLKRESLSRDLNANY
jgi:cytochrome oxidase Cu insertion factor (SCO1/SenC/PrrC family)